MSYSVKAEASHKFLPEGQDSLPGVSVGSFSVGSQSVNINMEPYGYVYASMVSSSGNMIKKPKDKTIEIPCSTTAEKADTTNLKGNGKCIVKSWVRDGHRADGVGSYTVEFTKPLVKGDKVIFNFADDGNSRFGTLGYIDEETQQELLKKEKEEENQRKEEEYTYMLFENAQKEEESKTWKDHIKDTFEDNWANFMGWIKS